LQPELKFEAELKDALEKRTPGGERRREPESKVMSRVVFGPFHSLRFSAATLLAAVTTVISNRHSRKDTLQLNANVARLNDGLLKQGRILRHAEPAGDTLNVNDALGTREV